MAVKISAGILMYRFKNNALEVLLVHPGGPFFINKDDGHWSIPKGECEKGESLMDTAVREFKEEVGLEPKGPFYDLGSIKQRGGKIVFAWAAEGTADPPNPLPVSTFDMEWPPHSQVIKKFPEIDKAYFMDIQTAYKKLKPAQTPFLDRLIVHLKNNKPE